MNKDEYEEYLSYLRQRSRIGQWYRNYWLYPQISRHLKGRALDVGCGIGDMLRYLPGTVGVDINPSTVEFCRDQGLDVHLMEPDLLPFGDGEFDSVSLDNVIEHIEEPLPLLNEIYRVLDRKGALIIGVPGQRGFASDPDHKVFYDESVLVSVLRKANFTFLKSYRMPLPFDFLSTRLRSYCIYSLFTPMENAD